MLLHLIFAIASLDVTAAFLNAPLLEGRVVVLIVREAPTLWSEERTESMTKVRFTSEGERYSVILSQIHKSLCLIVKTSSLKDDPPTDHLGLTTGVKPSEVIAMSGIYVDDYLTAGPPSIVDFFMKTLRRLWKTSEPQYLTIDHELTFLGVTLQLTSEGILLH